MFDPNNFFNALFVIPILNILVGIYKLLFTFGVPGALGFSVVILTVIIRFILHPLTRVQLKSTQKLNELRPELEKLQARFKDDKGRLHQEQLRLYREAGINPASGCLPLIVQMPILIALYNLFFQLLNNGNMAKVIEEINKAVYFPFLKINAFDLSFLGFNLGHKPSDWAKYGWWLLSIPLLTALLQYWQMKKMTPQTRKLEVRSEKLEDEKKDKKEDMGAAMQKQMAIMMPLMIGYFAYTFPLGLSLYWNTYTVFAIIEQNYLKNSTSKENGQSKKNTSS